jgi:isopentenyl-diphosphate delta-isomerase type 1
MAADEWFDLVDEDGRVTGRALRSQCHRDPALLHRAVHVFVFDRAGRLFLQRRARTKRIQPGRWDTSVGGHPGVGEDWEAAARREAGEELGLPPDVPFEYLGQHVWRSPVETELVRTWRCTFEGPFHLQAEELDDGRFFARDELAALVGAGQLTPNLEAELSRLGLLERP